MANFNAAILTAKGIALLAKAQAGQTNIQFTKAASGDGSYDAEESLLAVEALKAQMALDIVNGKNYHMKRK